MQKLYTVLQMSYCTCSDAFHYGHIVEQLCLHFLLLPLCLEKWINSVQVPNCLSRKGGTVTVWHEGGAHLLPNRLMAKSLAQKVEDLDCRPLCTLMGFEPTSPASQDTTRSTRHMLCKADGTLHHSHSRLTPGQERVKVSRSQRDS